MELKAGQMWKHVNGWHLYIDEIEGDVVLYSSFINRDERIGLYRPYRYEHLEEFMQRFASSKYKLKTDIIPFFLQYKHSEKPSDELRCDILRYKHYKKNPKKYSKELKDLFALYPDWNDA